MARIATLKGNDLRAMLIAGTGWLKKIVPSINALNVYPVPDGDCGTNMLLTMHSSLAEAAKLDNDAGISVMSEAIAKGALMGARGNSGVILSQIWRGLFDGMGTKETVDAQGLSLALKQASEVAYSALTNPVEGTILTVIRDAATAAEKEASINGANLLSTMEAAVVAARASVKNTPNLLPVLKDSGVVDAGGHGLYTLLEGALLHLKADIDDRSPDLLTTRLPLDVQLPQVPKDEEPFGFCTQFMIRGENLNAAEIENKLMDMGSSLMVVGGSSAIRVHIHTLDPDEVLRVASSYGRLVDKEINNMDEQHIEFLVIHQEKMTKLGTAIISVVNGDGMVDVFCDLGVSAVIPGGQTMNPSTMDMLQTVEKVTPDNIIFLPNNKNVIPTALLVQSITEKRIEVIPTETIPQGISALIAFIPENDFEINVEEMKQAVSTVRTIEITKATRNTKANGIKVEKGEIIGLLDGELLGVGDSNWNVIFQLLERIDAATASILTLYFGKDADENEAEQISERMHQEYPEMKIGVVNGGQPNYTYIISLE